MAKAVMTQSSHRPKAVIQKQSWPKAVIAKSSHSQKQSQPKAATDLISLEITKLALFRKNKPNFKQEIAKSMIFGPKIAKFQQELSKWHVLFINDPNFIGNCKTSPEIEKLAIFECTYGHIRGIWFARDYPEVSAPNTVTVPSPGIVFLDFSLGDKG